MFFQGPRFLRPTGNSINGCRPCFRLCPHADWSGWCRFLHSWSRHVFSEWVQARVGGHTHRRCYTATRNAVRSTEQDGANGSQCANTSLLDDIAAAQRQRIHIMRLRIFLAKSALAAVPECGGAFSANRLFSMKLEAPECDFSIDPTVRKKRVDNKRALNDKSREC
jgi:hypothetical protein